MDNSGAGARPVRRLAQLPEQPKRDAARRSRATAHSHQPCTSAGRGLTRQQRRQRLGGDATLLRLGRAVHLHQDPLPAPISRTAVELGGKIHAINGVDDGEPAYGVSRLVTLQRADQVPLDRHIGQCLLFLQGLLDPILTHSWAQPQPPPGRLRAMVLVTHERTDDATRALPGTATVSRQGPAEPGGLESITLYFIVDACLVRAGMSE